MPFEHLFFEGTPVEPVVPRVRSRAVDRFATATAKPEPVDGFVGELLRHARLPAVSYRRPALHRRTAACLRFLGAATAEEAVRRIAADPALVQSTLNVALLGVTEFFRDRCVFERLESEVLPELWSRHERLRIWSAACSGGHELYSVAMLLAEAGRLGAVELWGTDCRAAAVEQARCGSFEYEAVSRLELRWRDRYFTRCGRLGRVNEALRSATRWKTADLLSTVEPGPWHLILWRNMAIYLESAAADELWHRLVAQLAPGGYVMCGKADHPPAGLPLARVGRCFYQKRAAA